MSLLRHLATFVPHAHMVRPDFHGRAFTLCKGQVRKPADQYVSSAETCHHISEHDGLKHAIAHVSLGASPWDCFVQDQRL